MTGWTNRLLWAAAGAHDIEDYTQDIERVRLALEAVRGESCPPLEAYIFWSWRSNMWDAGWMSMPGDDQELQDAVAYWVEELESLAPGELGGARILGDVKDEKVACVVNGTPTSLPAVVSFEDVTREAERLDAAPKGALSQATITLRFPGGVEGRTLTPGDRVAVVPGTVLNCMVTGWG